MCRLVCCMSCGPAILFSSFVFVTSMLFAIAPGMSLLSTFAGQHTPNNSSIMPGMGLNRDKNSYLYPEYQRIATGDWKFVNYDMNTSYLVPDVSAYESDGSFSGPGVNFL